MTLEQKKQVDFLKKAGWACHDQKYGNVIMVFTEYNGDGLWTIGEVSISGDGKVAEL